MRTTSPETITLIQRLHEPFTLLENIFGSRNYAAILSEIAEANEPAAIVHIPSFLLSRDRNVAAAAASAVHKLLLATPLTDLPWLDENLRPYACYPEDHLSEWRNLSLPRLESLEKFGDTFPSLLSLASFHYSGYVRESAVRKLSLITTGAELPFLILRLNDWVTNVRDAAYEAVRARLRADYCRNFIHNLPLLVRLERAERADHEELLDEINRLLQSSECRPALFELLPSQDCLLRRTSFKLALDVERPDLDHVMDLAFASSDAVIRLWASQRLASGFEGAMIERFLDVIRGDRFMPVRREALRIAVRLEQVRNGGWAPLIEELHAALLDRHESIREESRYHLQKLKPIDFAGYYRQHLAATDEPTLYAAISGLGETGGTQDAGLILPYTSHRAGQIRRAAVRAIATLNPEPHVELFVHALRDPVPRVSRQAMKELSNRTSRLSAPRIWEIYRSATHNHVKRYALRLLEKFPKWESISYIVSTLCDADKKIVVMGHLGIQRWLIRFNRSFSTATPEQLGRLRAALENCGHLIDEAAREQLQFLARALQDEQD